MVNNKTGDISPSSDYNKYFTIQFDGTILFYNINKQIKYHIYVSASNGMFTWTSTLPLLQIVYYIPIIPGPNSAPFFVKEILPYKIDL